MKMRCYVMDERRSWSWQQCLSRMVFVPAKRSRKSTRSERANERTRDVLDVCTENKERRECAGRREWQGKNTVTNSMAAAILETSTRAGMHWTAGLRSKEETRVDQEEDKSPGKGVGGWVLHFCTRIPSGAVWVPAPYSTSRARDLSHERRWVFDTQWLRAGPLSAASKR